MAWWEPGNTNILAAGGSWNAWDLGGQRSGRLATDGAAGWSILGATQAGTETAWDVGRLFMCEDEGVRVLGMRARRAVRGSNVDGCQLGGQWPVARGELVLVGWQGRVGCCWGGWRKGAASWSGQRLGDGNADAVTQRG